jgi:hypothetical protein
MHTTLNRMVGLCATLAAAPLAGWASAVGLNQLGVGVAMATAGGGVIGSAFLVLSTAWFWRRAGRGAAGFVAGLGLLVVAAVLYGGMTWDASAPAPFDRARLIPAPGQSRAPRELVLHATADPKLGRAGQWPAFPLAVGKTDPTPEWLRAHAAEIQAGWAALLPVRDWVRQVDDYAVCDDYVERYDSPILAFRPLRELGNAHIAYALWLANEDRGDEAVHLLINWIAFARRLSGGSRSLVSNMIGVVIEQRALTALGTIHRRRPLSDSARRETRQMLGQPMDDWVNLQRVLLNEIAMFDDAATPDRLQSALLEGTWYQRLLLSPLLYNPNATAAENRANLEQKAAAAARGDLPALQQLDRQVEARLAGLHFKNPTGHLVLTVTGPATAKLAESVRKLRDQRAQLFAELNG